MSPGRVYKQSTWPHFQNIRRALRSQLKTSSTWIKPRPAAYPAQARSEPQQRERERSHRAVDRTRTTSKKPVQLPRGQAFPRPCTPRWSYDPASFSVACWKVCRSLVDPTEPVSKARALLERFFRFPAFLFFCFSSNLNLHRKHTIYLFTRIICEILS